MTLQLQIRKEARTLHDIFVERGYVKGGTWGAYWDKLLMEQADMYSKLGWKIIAISKGSKRPVAETAWATEPGLSRERMFAYTQQGFNLAVVAGPSQLAILDYDSKDLTASLEYAITQTLSICTPRGFAFITREPYSQKKFLQLKSRFPYFDKARINILYELVPLSKTCTQDFSKDSKPHECERHDYRIREWASPQRSILPFKDFVKLLEPTSS